MEKKITKKDNFMAIKAILEEMGKTELADVMAHEIELLEAKASRKKATKVQEANVGLKDTIVEILTTQGKPMTCTEVIKADVRVADLSTPKISAMMKQLIAEGRVVKTTEGKKSLFGLA